MISILYLILIFSSLDFIFSGVLIFYYKSFGSKITCIVFIIFIIISSIISIIFSSLNIYKYFKKKNKSLEGRKKVIDKISIILGILYFINLLLSYCCFAFGPNLLEREKNERLEKNISFIQLIPTIFVWSLPFFCYLSFLFWHSLHDFKGSINGCENCHICCCRKVEAANTTEITINIVENNINNISNSKINVNNEPKGPGRENDMPPEKTKEPSVPKSMKIHFKISTGQQYIINEPSNITIKKLLYIFFENLKIKETDRKSLHFLYGGNQLNINSDSIIANKLIEDIPIVVADPKNITNQNK